MGYIYNDLENLRSNIHDMIGNEIIVVESIKKRGKRLNRLATVDKTYDTFFKVTFENNQSVNYNYSDILTRDVKIKTFDGEGFVPLFVPRPLTKKETIPSLKIDDEPFPDIEDLEEFK